MDFVNIVCEIISNVGFPIGVCVACFWYINKQTDLHKQETEGFKEAINNNTNVLSKLLDKLSAND